MRPYSAEFKASLIAKMLPPHNRPVPDLARETQIPRDTLYNWRTQALKAGGDLVATSTPDERDSAAKFAMVVETAYLNAEELSAYCRRQGLYPQQLEAWRSACSQANAPVCGQAERAQRRLDQQRIKQLEQEVGRKDQALAAAAALLMLQKKSPATLDGPRGRLIDLEQRRHVSQLIDEACTAGACLERACDSLGLSPRTLQRWRAVGGLKADGRAAAAHRRTPANRLSENERAAILTLVNQPEFADQPPSQIVPALADQGEYLGSEATFYRVMKAANQVRHRGQARAPTPRRPEPLTATAPNQVWSGDITYLATTVKGLFFYLYVFLDVFSRKIVGWEVFASESAEPAATVLSRAYHREGVSPATLVLQADNGGPMQGATMLATLQRLGVRPSFSRPSVSDDNPFSEALFKTLTYHPCAPSQPFAGLEVARQWVAGFVDWYNEQHRHSALQFVTPGQRHRGEDRALLDQRRQLYEAARARHPERWSGAIRQWEPVSTVCLNPGRLPKQEANKTSNAT